MTKKLTTTATHGLASDTTSPSAPTRIVALDVLRGVALTGIIFVNIEPVTGFPYKLPTLADPSGWLQLFVQQRFFPLFSLLFGIGFSLIFESAQRRDARPRVVLLRRLLVLLPVGVLHQFFHPGEALTWYAVAGLLVLLPSTWLPRWLVAVGASVAVPAALYLAGGGLFLIPGAFLLGSALVRYGVAARLDGSIRVPALLFVASAVGAVPAVRWQLAHLENSGFDTASGVAGTVLAVAYATGILLLLNTPVRQVLVAAFAPLGRMALTNYLSATVVMVAAGHLLDLRSSTSWTLVLGLAAAIMLAQSAASSWWLRRYRFGPLEWLWRWVTWARRPTMNRLAVRDPRRSAARG